ncbi:MAG: hypothetical protein ABIK08_00595 [Pseudomonadota bacterium]
MVDIDVKLKAKNSSGEQTLWLQEDDGDYYFTLVGKYNGENIQIDFDTLSREKIEEIHLAIGLILETPNVEVTGLRGFLRRSG